MKKNILLLILFVLLFSGCYFNNTQFIPAPAGFHVAENSPFLPGYTITGMANNGGLVAAVSYEGRIAYSPDSGVSWETVPPENIKGNFGDDIRFNAIAWGEGYFLAVGDEGRAAYSADGINWQAGVIGPMSPKNILCVAAGSISGRTVFAVAGTDGRMAHALDSPAGPWYMADQTPFGSVDNNGQSVRALAWGKIKGNGVFVAAGDAGRIAILKDLSGKWYGGRAGTGETFRGLAYGNDRFVAVGGNGLIKYSLDPMSYAWITVKDNNLGQRPIGGVSFDPLIKHFVLYTDDTVIGFSEYSDFWNAANFQVRFSGGTPGDPEKVNAATCTALRIVLGGTRGTIAYSN